MPELTGSAPPGSALPAPSQSVACSLFDFLDRRLLRFFCVSFDYMPKYLCTFQKAKSVRWLGHLDILRTFERAIRRARLPIAFSSGYNPREKIAFASALSTGITGDEEPATIELTEMASPDEIVARLNEALPPGIRIHSCREIPDAGSRDLLNAFDRAEYSLVCGCAAGMQTKDLEDAICTMMGQTTIAVTREREGRSKSVNIRPFIYEIVTRDRISPERLSLTVQVAIGERGNAKPAEVVAALAEYLPGIALRRAHRLRLLASGAADKHSVSPTDLPSESEFAAEPANSELAAVL